jgi:NTE family protein
MRLVEIAMDQVRGLRARTLVNHFRQNANSGVYLKIGNTGRKILADSITDSGSHQALLDKSLADTMVHRAANFATTLRRLEVHEYELLFQHGWEVADHTLLALCPKVFGHQPIYIG